MLRSHAISLVGAAFGVLGAPRTASADNLDMITIVGPPSEDATALYYAVQNGMPQRFGLNIKVTIASSGTASTQAVVAGAYDVGRSDLLSILSAHVHNIPVSVVAPLNISSTTNPLELLQIAPDAPYKTGADLNGKTIGSPGLNDINVLATRAWVDKNGGDWRSLKLVEVPNSAIEAAISQHRVDAGGIRGAQLDASLEAKTTKTLGDMMAAIAPTFAPGVFVARADWASKNVDALRRFNRMMSAATSYVGTHHAETAQLVSSFTGIELDVVQKMRHRTIYSAKLDPALIQPVIDAAAKYELIPHAFPAREIITA
jgi:NitT/TauT family transport system substrate-binding protein